MAQKPVDADYSLRFTARFVRNFKRIGKHAEYVEENFDQLIFDFMASRAMPAFYREHALDSDGRRVDWTGYLSVDLSPDIRVIFTRNEPRREVVLHRIGSHAHLCG